MRRALRKRVKAAYNRATNLVLSATSRLTLEKIGSDYGGWIVPVDMIDLSWICYSAGSGDDITFDLGLLERFNCRVHAFDPTSLAAAHVKKVASGVPGFHFHPYGLWSEEGTVRFYEPKDPSMVSHSITNISGSTRSIEVPVRRATEVMKTLGHDRIDLLKLDIEGAEYAVLTDVLSAGVDIKVICVEFDRPVPLSAGADAMRRLLGAYHPVAVDGKNCTFIRKDLRR